MVSLFVNEENVNNDFSSDSSILTEDREPD